MAAATLAALLAIGWPASTGPAPDDVRQVGSDVAIGGDTLDGLVMPKLGMNSAPAAPTPAAAEAETPVAPPPPTFSGPAPRATPPPNALRQQTAAKVGGTWAVVIGVNDYPGSDADLKSAVNDANDVVQALNGLGVGNDRILALRDGQASAANIRAAVGWLTARAGPDAVAVFFFAGHVRKGGPGGEALVGADGSSIYDVDLAERLKGLSAREAWIGIAACYGGGFTEVMGPGRVLTGAAAANEVAYENTGMGRSYMVEYMVRLAMVEKRAPETVQTAFAWARDQLRRDYPNRVPVQFDQSDGVIDLRPPGVPPVKRQSTPPPPRSGGNESTPPLPPPAPADDCTETLTVRWCN